MGELVGELDCVVEPQPLLSFILGSGIVFIRLPFTCRLLLFNIGVEDPLDELPELESRVEPPAIKAALPCA